MSNQSDGPGKHNSDVEVTNVSRDGFWLLLNGREFFLEFDEFPWFREAAIGQLLDVRIAAPGHLRWPSLDIDLSVASLERPADFPLVSRVQAK
jgi:hypothetical protein